MSNRHKICFWIFYLNIFHSMSELMGRWPYCTPVSFHLFRKKPCPKHLLWFYKCTKVHKCSLKPRFTFKNPLLMAFEQSGALLPFSTFRWQATITSAHLHLMFKQVVFLDWPWSTTTAQINQVESSSLCSCDDSKDTVDLPTNMSVSGWMWR